jgi:hypothetical protein
MNSLAHIQSIDFKQKQQEFTAYIRNPKQHPVPSDVAESRMAVYRELFFNNIESFLSSGFPVLRQILTDAQWLALIEDFFARHHSETPYFCEIAEEFLAYLQQERSQAADSKNDYPFILELAHYEWVEMALSIAQVELPPLTEYIDDFLQQTLTVSPLAWPLAYRYPVHRLAPNYLPSEPPAELTYLIVYRGCDDQVGFIQITPMTFRLLQLIEQQPNVTLAACLEQIVTEMTHPNPEVVINGGLQIIQSLSAKSIVLVG